MCINRLSLSFVALVAAFPAARAMPSPETFGNLAYSGIYDRPVLLVDGVYEGEPFVPDGATRPRVELIEDLYAVDDIDGDGITDAWVLLIESSGGSGQFLYLGAVTYGNGQPRNIGTVNVGDRIDVIGLRSTAGRATLDHVAAGPGDAACCPTRIVSAVYGLGDGRLTELTRSEQGPLSLQVLNDTTWRLVRFDLNDPVPEDVSITAVFEDDRISGSAGCNRYFAALEEPTARQIRIGRAGSTRMACPPPQMAAEDRYLSALSAATRYRFLLGRLSISYTLDGNAGTLLFERTETP